MWGKQSIRYSSPSHYLANMIKKFTNKVKNPFHQSRPHSSLDVLSESLNDNVVKGAIPTAVSQDTLLNSAAPSRIDTANQAPVVAEIIEKADQPRSEECSTSQQSALVKAGSVAWKGLETALRLLEKSSGAFPPLKSAVSGLVACLDLTQVNWL